MIRETRNDLERKGIISKMSVNILLTSDQVAKHWGFREKNTEYFTRNERDWLLLHQAAIEN